MSDTKNKSKATAALQPVAEVPQPATVDSEKVSKIKRAFLYVLVGGLGLSALISIGAILVGEFNSVVAKALFTTLIFVSHSLIVLSIVLADRNNLIGKAIVPTVILGSIIANMLTASLGIWGIWDNVYSGRAILLYALFIGASFLYVWVRQLRIANTVTTIATNATIIVIAALTLLIGTLTIAPEFFVVQDPFFYRVISALTILGFTTLSIAAIFNRLALTQNPELAATAPKEPKLTSGLLAIVITVGSIVGLIWFIGLIAVISAGVNAENRSRYSDDKYRYERYYDEDRRDYYR